MAGLPDPTRLAFYKRLVSEAGSFSPRDLFREFCAASACALSMGRREEECLGIVKRLGAQPGVEGSATRELTAVVEAFSLLVGDMERRPYRALLGPCWMELNSRGAQWSGEFYTPQEVSRALAKILLAEREIPTDRVLTIGEPSCGSGGMVLSMVEVLAEMGVSPNRVWIEARDISKLACDMAYVNLALHRVPGEVVHGNTLSMEEWGRWPTPWRAFVEAPSPVEEAFRLIETLEAGRGHAKGEEEGDGPGQVQAPARTPTAKVDGGGRDPGMPTVRSGRQPQTAVATVADEPQGKDPSEKRRRKRPRQEGLTLF